MVHLKPQKAGINLGYSISPMKQIQGKPKHHSGRISWPPGVGPATCHIWSLCLEANTSPPPDSQMRSPTHVKAQRLKGSGTKGYQTVI